MPYRKVTGMISHRHPFYGYSGGSYYTTPDMYDFDIASVDRLYSQVQGYGQEAAPGVPAAGGLTMGQRIAGTLVMAGIGGAGLYFIAKFLQRPEKSAAKWGGVGAVALAVLSLLGERRG